MTRAQKIHKLANAVRAYRGAGQMTMGRCAKMNWLIPPQPTARARVETWLGKLGVDVKQGMAAVDGLKSVEQFNRWLNGL